MRLLFSLVISTFSCILILISHFFFFFSSYICKTPQTDVSLQYKIKFIVASCSLALFSIRTLSIMRTDCRFLMQVQSICAHWQCFQVQLLIKVLSVLSILSVVLSVRALSRGLPIRWLLSMPTWKLVKLYVLFASVGYPQFKLCPENAKTSSTCRHKVVDVKSSSFFLCQLWPIFAYLSVQVK